MSTAARTGVAGLSLGLATLVLVGCGLAGGGGSSSAKTVATTATTAATTSSPLLVKLACQQYDAVASSPYSPTAFRDYFAADAEADQARTGASTTVAAIVSALDAVKMQVQMIDQLQPNASSNTGNGGTLEQALGSLQGYLTVLNSLCAPLTGNHPPAAP
jgi:hypothetical protein